MPDFNIFKLLESLPLKIKMTSFGSMFQDVTDFRYEGWMSKGASYFKVSFKVRGEQHPVVLTFKLDEEGIRIVSNFDPRGKEGK